MESPIFLDSRGLLLNNHLCFKAEKRWLDVASNHLSSKHFYFPIASHKEKLHQQKLSSWMRPDLASSSLAHFFLKVGLLAKETACFGHFSNNQACPSRENSDTPNNFNPLKLVRRWNKEI